MNAYLNIWRIMGIAQVSHNFEMHFGQLTDHFRWHFWHCEAEVIRVGTTSRESVIG